MAVKHALVSAIADDAQAASRGEVVPSDWNANHTVDDNTLLAAKLAASATDILFGRSTAAAGAGEEIACTAAGRALLDDATAAAQRTTLAAGLALQFQVPLGNPVDATTYYIGNGGGLAGLTASGPARVYIPRAGTVTRIDLVVGVAGTLGTAGQQATANFRLNNSTDTLISSAIEFSAASQAYTVAVSIAIAAGDYFEIKVLTPTWTTNPTNAWVCGTVYIE